MTGDLSISPAAGFCVRRLLRDVSIAMLLTPLFSAAAPATKAPSAGANPPPASKPAAAPVERQLHYVITIDAEQSWKKNDPKYPGDQWSKATTRQRHELTTRLRSDGALEVRNINDFDLDTRIEAKTIFLARQAARDFERSGKPFRIPKTEADKDALSKRFQTDMFDCQDSAACGHAVSLRYAAIFAVLENPEALEPDTETGTYYYFLPFGGCPNVSRVQLEMQIDGMRINKTSGKLVPFSEHRSADTINGSDGLELCDHFTAVIDTTDKPRSLYLDNVFLPRPIGKTTYTEGGHTSVTAEPQPVPTAAIEWIAEILRHNTPSGQAAATVPLPLSLNGNSTWLGLWTGSAKVTVQWNFSEVPAAAAARKS